MKGVTLAMSDELRLVISLYFAQIALAADADKLLIESGLGRPHHRVIVFVGLRPGLAVGELLKILRIRGQSLNPILSQLMQRDLITQTTSERDRRRRHLYLTKSGAELQRFASSPQIARIQGAMRQVGRPAVKGFLQVVDCLMDQADQSYLAEVSSKSARYGVARSRRTA